MRKPSQKFQNKSAFGFIISLTLNLSVATVWAQHSESKSGELPVTSSTEALSPKPQEIPSPFVAPENSGTPALSSDNKGIVEANQKVREANEALSSQDLLANTLLFWNAVRGEKPTPELLSAAKVDEETFNSFTRTLSKKFQLNPTQLKIMRTEPSPDNFPTRVRARMKFLGFVNAYQQKFPTFGSYLPEILTVWGEARNLGGFEDRDILFQQAKIASVIHVLRNRVERFCKLRKRICSEKEKAEIKWKLATKRFQFSSFEPYDTNLSEIILGFKGQGPLNELSKLPALDQRALNNLSETLLKMNRSQIVLENPLGSRSTRHYITPVLLPFEKTALAKALKELEGSKDRKLLNIPTKKPKFYAVVPSWISQKALITDPLIKVEDFKTNKMTDQSIPPREFIYFGGLK